MIIWKENLKVEVVVAAVAAVVALAVSRNTTILTTIVILTTKLAEIQFLLSLSSPFSPAFLVSLQFITAVKNTVLGYGRIKIEPQLLDRRLENKKQLRMLKQHLLTI